MQPVLQHLISNREFIAQIIDDAHRGRCFVPFIGSGLSSASGIIMGQEFTKYLAYTFYLIVAEPKHPSSEEPNQRQRWALDRQGWPDYPSEANVKEAYDWISSEFEKICSRYGWEINPDKSSSIYGVAVKSLTSLDRSASRDLYDTMAKPPVPLLLRGENYKDRPDRFRQVLESVSKRRNDETGQPIPDFDDYLLDHGMSYAEQITEKGIRALADWKATLTFLSRLRVHGESNGHLTLESPDSSIIDAFNTFITRGKKPNLGHKMLAQLAKPLRFRTLLTTNFDTLTEAAFEALNQKIKVLAVSNKGDLPSAHTVGAQDTLVKLHGDSHDTRADMSLDEEPTDFDKRTFQDYLTRKHRDLSIRPSSSVTHAPARSDVLLVVGYSGGDHRCIQMIKHWLENGEGDPRIYWICYNDWDASRVQDLFRSERFAGRVISTQSARPDLLLFELYQRLELTLPPGGTTYEFLHAAPPSRESGSDKPQSGIEVIRHLLLKEPNCHIIKRIGKENTRALAAEIISQAIEKIIKTKSYTGDAVSDRFLHARKWAPYYRDEMEYKPKSEGEREPWIVVAATAVAQATSSAYSRLAKTSGKKIFWFELEDHLDGNALLREFLRMLAVRCGVFMTNHVTMHPETVGLISGEEKSAQLDKIVEEISTHIKATLRSYRVDPETIVVFLYGRDSYGQCAGLSPVPVPWSDTVFRQLHILIEAFAKTGIPVIYFPLTEAHAKERKNRTQELRESIEDSLSCDPHHAQLREKKVRNKISEETNDNTTHDPLIYPDTPQPKSQQIERDQEIAYLGTLTSFTRDTILTLIHGNYTFGGRLNQGIMVIDKKQKFELEFLYALTLFRTSRFPTALFSENVFTCPFRFNRMGIDNDRIRAIATESLVKQLITLEVFYEKPGGLLWFHGDVRRALQKGLENAMLSDVQNLSTEEPKRVKNQSYSLKSYRSRIHFGIADWYMKAFLSSGHIAPLIECLYHLCSSAFFAKDANFRHKTAEDTPESKSELLIYRLLTHESALLQATRNIMVAWNKIEFWQASSQKVSWLQHTNELGDKLRQALLDIERKPKLNGPALHAVDIFVKTLNDLSEAIVLAGSSASRNIKYVTNLHHWTANPESKHEAISKGEAAEEQSPQPLSELIQHDWVKIGDTHGKFDAFVEKTYSGRIAKKVPKAIKSFCDSIIEERSLGKIKSEVRASLKTTEDYQHFVWLITETAYLHLRRGKASYHAFGAINWKDWLKCSLYCNLGIDLCKHLAEDAYHFELTYKAKLQGIYGIALANLGRFDEANRHLLEAQSLVRASATTTLLDHAIVKCRMAEWRLTQCFWMKRILRSTNFKIVNNRNWLLPYGLKVLQFYDESTDPDSIRNRGRQRQTRADDPDGQMYPLDKFIVDTRPVSTCYGNSMDSGGPSLLKNHFWELYSKTATETAIKKTYIPFMPWEFQEILHAKMPIKLSVGSSRSVNSRLSINIDPSTMDTWHRDFLRDLSVQFRSNLDDAFVSLENAEAMLQGVSHNSHWWFQLRLMQLRIYGYLSLIKEDAGQCLVFRRTGAREGISKAFHDAWRIAGSDPFRLMRTLRYLHEAQVWFEESPPIIQTKPYSEIIDRLISDLKLTDDNLLRKSWENIKKDLGHSN